jgi:LPS O-antigen subunit length determinant protein (WzzB/FepE family)
MSINETLKKKIDELDLDRLANELTIQAERGIGIALAKAGDLAGQHQDDITSWLDKASDLVDEKTQGKYAEHVAKVKASVSTGVSKLIERQEGGPR